MCDATAEITLKSQEEKAIVDLTLVILSSLLVITAAGSVEYYRQIRKAQKEYEKSKTLVEDIVLSFMRELARESDRLEALAFKVEGNLAKIDTSSEMIDNLEKKLAPLENQIGSILLDKANVMPELAGLDSKIKDVEGVQEALRIKISSIEEDMKKLSAIPEVKMEPVVPIKRDRALAALTETEVVVLEMLISEGPKTAPEIKERVKLSREHTARLMKKLYETGYLERVTDKIPFKYSVKKEMEKFLEKPENKQS